MNKTMRRIVSLVVAMTFVIVMAVPAVFAAPIALNGDEHWELKMYADEACTKQIDDLAPNQTAFVQVELVNLDWFGSAAIKLNATGDITILETNTKAFFDNANGALLAADVAKMEAPTDGDYNKVLNAGKSASIQVTIKGGESYTDMENFVFPVTADTNLVLGTIKIQTGAGFTSGKIELEAATGVGVDGFGLGEQAMGMIIYSDISEGSINLDSVGLPAVGDDVTADDLEVVQEANDDAEAVENISINDGDTLFGSGSDYYFRVPLTNGTNGYFKIVNTAVATPTEPTAYIGSNDFTLGEEDGNSKTVAIKSVTLEHPAYGITGKAFTAAGDGSLFDVTIQGALYQFKADAFITIPRGDTSITLTNEAFVALLEKSIDGGTTWDATIEGDEINSGEDVTLTVAENMGNEGTSIADTAVTISPEVTLTGKTTLTLVVGKAESKGNYRVKGNQTFTLYVSNETFNKDIALEEEFTDGWHDAGTTADLTGATITIADWDTIKGKETDPAGVVKAATVTWTEGETQKTATGDVTIIIKAAEPVEDSYRVVSGQSFDLEYNTDFETLPTVAFEQEMKASETEFIWEACELPEGYTYELGDEYEINKPGTYTVTVTLKNADGEEIPMTQNTITVVVAEMLYDEYQVSLADGVDAYPLTYKTAVSAIDTSKLVVKQAKIANGNTDKTFEEIAADAAKIKFMTGNADLSVDAAYITEDLARVTVLYNGIAAGTIDVAVEKQAAAYTATWYNNTNSLTVPANITAEELAELVVVKATYGTVTETIDADVTIDDFSATATSVKVMLDGIEIAELNITVDAAATGTVLSINIPVVGVAADGLTATTSNAEATAIASGSNIKVVVNQATAADAAYTVSIPGFTSVTVNVTADGAISIAADGAQALYAGDLAAEPNVIDDADFYAIAANLNGDATANAKYDLNKDGKIDALDIDVMLSNLGATIIAE